MDFTSWGKIRLGAEEVPCGWRNKEVTVHFEGMLGSGVKSGWSTAVNLCQRDIDNSEGNTKRRGVT